MVSAPPPDQFRLGDVWLSPDDSEYEVVGVMPNRLMRNRGIAKLECVTTRRQITVQLFTPSMSHGRDWIRILPPPNV